MHKCAKNSPSCQGLELLKKSILRAMVEDFKQEVMIEDDDDNIEEYTDMMYKHHDKYFV